MLTKCKAVCCLYDKVQLAGAKMLDKKKMRTASVTAFSQKMLSF